MTEKIGIASISVNSHDRRDIESACSFYQLHSTNFGSRIELFAFDDLEEAYEELTRMAGLAVLILDVSQFDQEDRLFELAVDLLEQGLLVEQLVISSSRAREYNDEDVMENSKKKLSSVTGDLPPLEVHRRPLDFPALTRSLKRQRNE